MREESDCLLGWDAHFLAVRHKQVGTKLLYFVDTVDGHKQMSPPADWTCADRSRARRVLDGEALLVNRPFGATEPAFTPAGDESRLSASIMDVPLFSGNEVIGAISAQSYTPYRYGPDELALLQRVADMVAPALERVYTEARLRESEERWRTLMDNMPAAVRGYQIDGTVTYWNRASERIYGYTAGEALGKSINELIIPPEMHTKFNEALAASGSLNSSGEFMPSGELILRRKDGSRVPVHSTHTAVRPALGPVTTLFSLDIDVTGRKRAEEALLLAHEQVLSQRDQLESEIAERKRSEEEREAFARLAARLAASASVEDVVNVVREETEVLLGWDSHFFTVRDEAEDGYRVLSLVDTIEGQKRLFSGQKWPALKGSPRAGMLLKGKAYLLNRSSRDDGPRFEPFGDKQRLSASILDVPICSGERVIGILSVHSYTPNKYNEDHVELLKRVADMVAPALERAYAERALRESELFLKQTQQIARLGGWKANPHTDYMEWSDAVYDILEAPRDQMPGFTEALSYCLPEYAPALRESVSKCLLSEQPFTFECQAVTTSGKRLWVEIRGLAPVTEGAQSYVIGTLQDISERKQVEAQLHEAKQFAEQIFQSAAEGIVVYDRELKYLAWNSTMEKLTGVPAREVLGKHSLELFSHLREYEVDRLIAQALAGQVVSSCDMPYKVPRNEKKGWVTGTYAPYRDARGKIIGAIGVIRDITERREAEERNAQLAEQLRQSQKMQAVGQLAGGVAHNFNNLLLAISGYSETIADALARRSSHPRERCLHAVAQLRKAVEMGTALTQRLRAFCRKRVVHPVALNPDETIAGMLTMLRDVLGAGITLTMEAAESSGYIHVDPGQIEESILNLVLNARDAMPSGGTVTIGTSKTVLEETVAERNSVEPGSYVCITVTDTGTGMSEETLSRLFEPFFTTKPLGQGAGLGLSTIYGFVKQAGGFVAVDSELGKGTTFRLYLPESTERPKSAAIKNPVSKPSGEGRTVLVCEDDDMIRELVVRYLAKHGFAVIAASDAESALQTLSSREVSIDVLLSDIQMRAMSGIDLARELKQRYPSMKSVLISGHPDYMLEEADGPIEDVTFLCKPFQMSELLRVLP